VSQSQLDSGRRYCFLFTDVANETSNRIYAAVGYEPIRDISRYSFERDLVVRDDAPADATDAGHRAG
jgi:hypothetical protein